MSKRDVRKALTLRLPDELRLRLVKLRTETLPLAYLMRQALIRAFRDEVEITEIIAPGTARPILLQLSQSERKLLAKRVGDRVITDEVAVLSLISAVV
jgi:predicted DNA-binding protein